MPTEDAALKPAEKLKGRCRICAGAPSIILSTGKQNDQLGIQMLAQLGEAEDHNHAHRCTVDKPAPWGTRPLENLHD